VLQPEEERELAQQRWGSFTFECPHGLSSARACKVGFEEILDIQLVLYEAMMRHELAKKAGQEKIL